MATGPNTSGTLAEGLPEIIADARIRAEFDGIYARVTTKETQEEGTGLNWTRTILEKLEAQDITETTENHNFQLFEGAQITVEPQMTQIVTKVTDRFYRKQAKVVSGKVGQLTGNAMARKKDKDFIALFSTFNTAVSPGAGNPLSFGNINAAASRIKSNTSEPSMAQINTVVRGEQLYDVQAEILAGVGTFTIPEGMTEDVFKQGFRGKDPVGGTHVWIDDNIPTFGTTNARGAVFSKAAAIWVQSMAMNTERDRDIYFGGGADVLSMVDEYGFVEDGGGFWAFQLVSDATPPTS